MELTGIAARVLGTPISDPVGFTPQAPPEDGRRAGIAGAWWESALVPLAAGFVSVVSAMRAWPVAAVRWAVGGRATSRSGVAQVRSPANMGRAVTSLLLLGGMAAYASGHGAVTHPRPRNAIDGRVAPWNATVPSNKDMPFMFWCAHPDSESTDPRKVTGSNGQACFFFNNGCDSKSAAVAALHHPAPAWRDPPYFDPCQAPQLPIFKTRDRRDGGF